MRLDRRGLTLLIVIVVLVVTATVQPAHATLWFRERS